MKLKNIIIVFLLLFVAGVNAQIKFNRSIPNEAHKKITQLLPKGINSFSFSPNGGWVIITKNNGYFARNIPNECYNKIKDLKSKGHKIRQVSFPPKGGSNSWIIITDKTTFARNIPKECHAKIQEFKKKGKRIKSVSFPYKNIYSGSNNAWVIITTDGNFYAKNIPDECYQVMRNLRESDMPGKRASRKINQVSFTPSGGWVVLADDYFFARNIPSEAFNKLKSYRKNKYKSHIIAFTPNGKGWSLIANEKYSRAPKDLIKKFENSVTGKSIWEVMREKNISGVSIAVVINGKVAWETAYGHLKKGEKKYAVHPESMFQAASVSKFITAIGAYKMTKKYGTIALDDDLRASNSKLSVNIPIDKAINRFTGTVSIKNILRHRSGINGQGYVGYDVSVPKVPNLNEIIAVKSKKGKASVNSRPISIKFNDGKYNYSGAAFTILQKLIEDITKISFSSWMKTQILNPMGMRKSKFTINPENVYSKDQLSWGYSRKPVRNRYPEYAAAGLYTSSKELANVLIMLTNNGKFNNKRIINSTNLSLLRNGIGSMRNDGKIISNSTSFGHGGINRGYRSLVLAFPNINKGEIKNAGIVIMFNGTSTQFRYDLANAIIDAYGW